VIEVASEELREGKKRKITSIVLVWMITATFLIVYVPLHVPTVKAVDHLSSAAWEDHVGLPYDIGPLGDGEVIWDPNADHNINEHYIIEEDMTLNIPALDYTDYSGMGSKIQITDYYRIEVYGKLITNSDGSWMTKTGFIGTSLIPSEGIFFYNGSEGRIVDSLIKYSAHGVVFLHGSKLISPGVHSSAFVEPTMYGLQMDGARGYTNVANSYFDDREKPKWSVLMTVTNGSVNITNTNFISHRNYTSQLEIQDADVYLDHCTFYNDDVKGHSIFIEGDSNGTVLNHCDFEDGLPGYHYIKSEGVSFLIDNSSFVTAHGALSVLASDNATTGVPSHVTIRNPTADGWPGFWDSSFDNSTINVTGNSSITLQWYQNVNVIDPDGNSVENAPVWVKDRYGNPAEPSLKMTTANGWAEWFTTTELILYESSVTNFNSYNSSAMNNSMMGYINPETAMDMSKEIAITVPFSPIPNTPPVVSYIQTPSGLQAGPVSIQFKLEDPDLGDHGNMSITVEFWDPFIKEWKPATAHPTSDPVIHLKNNILYTFIWDSNDLKGLPDKYSTNLKIKITPADRAGNGTSSETGFFTLDNILPKFLTGPFVTPTNDTALIEWTVDKSADASVWYGIDDSLTQETWGSTGSTLQVVTLTDLSPGRKYSFVINSTRAGSNKNSSYPTTYTFETEIYIQLYKGRNMISIAPILTVFDTETVLASIAGEYDSVQWYDASDPIDPWKQYIPGKSFGNDLPEIYSEMGLWINMKNDAVLIHDNIVPPTFGMPVQIYLLAGWNFVAYPSVTTRTVDQALRYVNYDIVQTYIAPSGQWLSWNGSYGNLTFMELGRGYWIHVPSDQMWNITYV
jgi:hypothetical protein